MKHLYDQMLVTDPLVGCSVSERVLDLAAESRDDMRTRDRIRRIMDGGNDAVAALLGEGWATAVDGMPVANMMLSGMTRLAQKLGRRPDVKVDPPVSVDSDAARKRVETKVRIVESYDADAKLELKLPQIGRWLPGYGFCALVLEHGTNSNGDPYPHLGIRDPYETFFGAWGVEQQPQDVAFMRTMPRHALMKMYPQFAEKIAHGRGARSEPISTQGRHIGNARWDARGRDTVEVFEYMNIEGSWWVMPEGDLVLNFVRNPTSRTPFYGLKRYSFSKLTSQYEHVIGLMAALARMNLLSIVAAEDAVMAETNIVGDLVGDTYNTGRGAVNFFTPGSQVVKMNNNVPFQALQQADRLERQLRLVASYPVTDDSISPNSFVTGRGLDELGSAVDREVREYFTLLTDALVEFDSRRLEWDEKAYGSRQKMMHGVHDGAQYADKYRPASAIKGDYRTRRAYGAMAGFDDSTKIITGLQLMQADIIDADTMREQIDGLENHTKIKERIRAEKSERVLFDMALQMASQGDQRAVQLVADFLPDGEMRARVDELFGLGAQQAQAEAQAAEQAQLESIQGPPDTTTVLSRLVQSNSGVSPVTGVQTVGQL